MLQREVLRRAARLVRTLGGRPASRPLARDASALTAVRFAPTRAATLTMAAFPRPNLDESRGLRLADHLGPGHLMIVNLPLGFVNARGAAPGSTS